MLGVHDNALSLYDCVSGHYLWHSPLPSSAVRPMFVSLCGGGNACTDFDAGQGVRLHNADGKLVSRRSMPGIATWLGAWPGESVAFARILVGDGFHAYRIKNDSVKKLANSLGVMTLVAGPRNTVFGAWSDGRVSAWSLTRKHYPIVNAEIIPGYGFQGVAVAREKIARLWISECCSLIEWIDFPK